MQTNQPKEDILEAQNKVNLLVQLGQTDIRRLKLPKQIVSALIIAGITTVNDLTSLSERELSLIKRVGPNSVAEIQKALNQAKENLNSIHQIHSTQDVAKRLIQLGNTTVESLKISTKAANRLARAKIFTIADLAHRSPDELLRIHGVGEKTLMEIQNALQQALNSPADYMKMASIESVGEAPQKQPPQTWAEIIEAFLRSEKENYIYVFISRFGFKKKTLQELGTELDLSFERIRQMERRTAEKFIRYTGFPMAMKLLDQVIEVLSGEKESLSLPSLKLILTEKGILGEFSGPIRTQRYEADLFETLIAWLDILSDSRFTNSPKVFPIEIADLRQAISLSIKEYKAMQEKRRNKKSAKEKELLRKIAYTGGIHLSDAMKILSADEQATRFDLRHLNLLEMKDGWFSPGSLAVTGKKQPLISAGKKMLSLVPEIEFSSFYEGLSRSARRYFDFIAPPDIVLHYIKLAGLEFKENRVSYAAKVQSVLPKGEQCLIDAIRANGNVARRKVIVAAFRQKGFSQAALISLLAHSPVSERVDFGLYKIRGLDVPASTLDRKEETKNFSKARKVV